MAIDFSTLHLLIDGRSPAEDTLSTIIAEEEDFSLNDNHYLIKTSIIGDEYFWFYARYGKALPYSSTVFNIKRRVEEDNPRSTDQIETDRQFFCLYSFKDKNLYASSSRQKDIFAAYLKYKLDKKIDIKYFFISDSAFLKQIKSVDKIKFVSKRNLFVGDTGVMSILPSPNDLFGLGMPDNFTIEANFTNAKITKEFTEKFKRLFSWKNTMEADSLLCVGRDDNNFESIFNVETFVRKVVVPINRDSQGMYDENIIMQTLITKIKGANNENNS